MSEGIHPIASLLAAVARGITGVQVQWAGCDPDERQRIYFANHTSHLDFVVLWSALPSEIRAHARPIAAKDYWEETPVRRYLAENVFKAVLVERGAASKVNSHEESKFVGRSLIADMAAALGQQNSVRPFLFAPDSASSRIRAVKTANSAAASPSVRHAVERIIWVPQPQKT